MARKRSRISGRILFTWFMLAGFILILAPQNLTNKFQLAFAHIFHWPLSIGRNISLSALMQQSPTDVFSRKENLYQNHIANLEEQLLQKHEKVSMLSGLRDRLYALKGAKLMPADVITASINGLRSELVINRGQSDGLLEGCFVLGDNSIIGTISDASSRTARVKLITDPAFRIAVKVAGLDVDCIMEGAGNNSAKIRMLSIKHEVKIGDEVCALKKPGLLDAPMIVGKVAQCKRDDENPLLWDVTVEPVCDIERLSNVAVVIMNPQE